MKLFTKAQEARLIKNAQDGEDSKRKPVVKLFGGSSSTWLISEKDGDQLFGLCDLGMGYPELGYVSQTELEAVRFQFGLRIERDLHFRAEQTISDYAAEAQQAGRILA